MGYIIIQTKVIVATMAAKGTSALSTSDVPSAFINTSDVEGFPILGWSQLLAMWIAIGHLR